MTWVPYSLGHGLNPFSTRLFDFPTGANLLWPGPPLLLALLVWPITAWLGPVVAYDAAMVLALATAGIAGYLCCRRWVRRPWAAVAGGVIFGFSPFVTGQASGHIVYAAVALLPLILLTMDELLVRDRWPAGRAGALLGGLGLVQLLTAEELLAGAFLLSIVGAAVLAWMHPNAVRARLLRLRRGLTWAVAVFVPGAAYPLWYQFLGPGSIHGHVLTASAFSANLAELVVPGYQQAVTSPATADLVTRLQGHSGEVGAYVGLPMVVVLVLVWARRPAGAGRFFAVMAAIAAVLTLGPVLRIGPLDTHVPLPEAAIGHIPVVGDLLPVRLSMDLDLFVAVTFALYLDPISRRAIDRWPRILALLAAACWAPSVTAPVIAAPVPRYFSAGAPGGGRVLLVLPVAENADSDLPMLWQAASGMRFAMPEGYYHIPARDGRSLVGPAFTPLTAALTDVFLGDAPPPVTPRLRRQALSYLASRDVSTVVAGPEPHRLRAVRFVSAILGVPPVDIGGVDRWHVPALRSLASSPSR